MYCYVLIKKIGNNDFKKYFDKCMPPRVNIVLIVQPLAVS